MEASALVSVSVLVLDSNATRSEGCGLWALEIRAFAGQSHFSPQAQTQLESRSRHFQRVTVRDAAAVCLLSAALLETL